MGDFRQIDLEDIEARDLTITGVTAIVKNNKHENVVVNFNEPQNALGLNVTNTELDIHVSWRYSVFGFTVSGTGDITGEISYIFMNMIFLTQDKEGHLIPKVDIKDFDINFNASEFRFDFNCNACPGNVVNIILNAMRGPLLNQVRNQARRVFDAQVVTRVNDMLKERFPTSVSINNELSLSTANMGPIKITKEFLFAGIDGTIFLTNEGYSRPFNAPNMEIKGFKSEGEILVFISDYVEKTAEKSLNKMPISFQTSLLGMTVNVDVDGTRHPIDFTTNEKGLHVSGGVTISIPLFRTVYDIGASADVEINFKAGSSRNMFYIDPYINRNSLRFTSLRITFLGIPINLSWFSGLINFFVALIMDWVVFPEISIPQPGLLQAKAHNAQIQFLKDFTVAAFQFRL
jgi:hypothetical protein